MLSIPNHDYFWRSRRIIKLVSWKVQNDWLDIFRLFLKNKKNLIWKFCFYLNNSDTKRNLNNLKYICHLIKGATLWKVHLLNFDKVNLGKTLRSIVTCHCCLHLTKIKQTLILPQQLFYFLWKKVFCNCGLWFFFL